MFKTVGLGRDATKLALELLDELLVELLGVGAGVLSVTGKVLIAPCKPLGLFLVKNQYPPPAKPAVISKVSPNTKPSFPLFAILVFIPKRYRNFTPIDRS
jgi:hypothetical protein